METERDNATQGRSDEFGTTSRAAPQHGAAFVGNRLASLQCYSGHHRQAQRGRHEHRAALASKPAAAPGLQGQASLIGRWASLARAKRWCPRRVARPTGATGAATPRRRTAVTISPRLALDARHGVAPLVTRALSPIKDNARHQEHGGLRSLAQAAEGSARQGENPGTARPAARWQPRRRALDRGGGDRDAHRFSVLATASITRRSATAT